MISSSWRPVAASRWLTPRTIPPKNGSVNSKACGSETTRATESVRWLASARAVRLGT
jgi:hypothetical protein